MEYMRQPTHCGVAQPSWICMEEQNKVYCFGSLRKVFKIL